MFEPVDLFVSASPGSLSKCVCLTDAGRFRIARKDAELYSVMIAGAGSWGRIRVEDGVGRALFEQPSTFTGSFVLAAGAESGIVVELAGARGAPNLQINWRELPD